VSAPRTFAGYPHERVLEWAERHPDARIQEISERWRDVLIELDEALIRAERAELMLDETVERLTAVERQRAELEAALAPPDPD
jgi:hypothetical protein